MHGLDWYRERRGGLLLGVFIYPDALRGKNMGSGSIEKFRATMVWVSKVLVMIIGVLILSGRFGLLKVVTRMFRWAWMMESDITHGNGGCSMVEICPPACRSDFE